MDNLTEIQNRLFSLADEDYKEFHHKLIPTVSYESIIGVRTPQLRRLAKEIFLSGSNKQFLDRLPHRFYEENNLHAFLLEQINDYELLVEYVNRFLPYVDNWATCDMMSPRIFSKSKDKLYKDAYRWIDSGVTYAVRFGICILMKHYLDESFKIEYLEKVASIKSDEYYVNMAVAWYFATALAKQYKATLPYVENRRLDMWAHNKTIQKARESFLITTEQKEYLKTLKVNG